VSAQELQGTALRDFLGDERKDVQLRNQSPSDMQAQVLAAQERLQEKKLYIEAQLQAKLTRVNVALAVMDKANGIKVYRGTSYPVVTQELLDRANEVVLASLVDGYYDAHVDFGGEQEREPVG
jgi:methionine salvage enolase-phosphatase E1